MGDGRLSGQCNNVSITMTIQIMLRCVTIQRYIQKEILRN